jgi:hypothetical protein
MEVWLHTVYNLGTGGCKNELEVPAALIQG